MDQQNIWESIPHGKSDPPMLLWDLTKPLPYDFNDPDSQYVMFNRGLEGCMVLPFSKAMEPVCGQASADGRNIPCTVQKVNLGGFEIWWLGVKPGGILHDYGKRVTLKISGFRDTDGNEMLPADLVVETAPKRPKEPAYAAHETVALQAAQDGIVLLKNDAHALPLEKGNVLNFFGKGLTEWRICAVGVGKVTPRYTVGLLEAAHGETDYVVNEELVEFYACGTDVLPDDAVHSRARERSDTAFFVISRAAGENNDNSTNPGEYYLTPEEEGVLCGLRERFAKLVVILNVGYPISVAFAEKYRVDALVYSGFGGMFAGIALMDVLTGRVNPSGRLPDTWSECYESIPASKNFYDCAGGKRRIVSDDSAYWLDTVYEEDLYVGYRYFESFADADRRGFPFGYGLSYTTFAIEGGACERGAQELTVRARVTNTGETAGREVVQLYVSKPQGALVQPALELIGFEKTRLLLPGESEELLIRVPMSCLLSYDESICAYVTAAGFYRLYIGGHVRSLEEIGGFEEKKQTIAKQVKSRMKPNMEFSCMTKGDCLTGKKSGVRDNADSLQPRRAFLETFLHEPLPKPERPLTFLDVQEDESLLAEFVGGMDVKTLARIAVCASDGWGMEGRGEAGRLYRPEGLHLPEFVVADGNSGVNMREGNIGMPSGATLCASFDRKLMEQVGAVIGEEAKALGVHMILAPGMNLHRNPLNGRQPEYFSEDPYLAGVMAGWYCRGLESTGVGGCYKHLIANNAESGRKRNQSVLTERAIRELYFKTFMYALEVHEPLGVMTAYNAVNGVFTSCDPELIQGLLYEECSFRGFVMTDWASYDSADVVEMAAAGNAWITPGSEDDTFTSLLEAAVADGRLPLAQLQDNVRRIVRALLILNR